MPCFFFNNLPIRVFDHTWFTFQAEEVVKLRDRISRAVGCPAEEVELHMAKSEYKILNNEGRLVEHSVHIEVDWHSGRTPEIKMTISKALFDFMKIHGLENDLDITFRDSPPDSFYVEKGGQITSVSWPKLPIDFWPR